MHVIGRSDEGLLMELDARSGIRFNL
jgi:hypothetical protein